MQNHTRETWIDAAFAQFNLGGLASVKVESIGRQLYASKGSFYWHFDNRQDLIKAIMAKWEQRETANLLEIAEQAGSPIERLVTLYTIVGERMYERGGERTLYSEAEAEGVLPFVASVTNRRIEYIARILTELGLAQPEARASIAVAVVVGLQQLVTGGWEPLSGNELTEMVVRMSVAP